MLLVPNRRRTRRRTSRVKRGVSSKDYYLHIKLDGWRNAYASPDVIPFEGGGWKPAAELSENQYLGFLHQLRGIASLGWRYPRLADYRNVSVLERSSVSKQLNYRNGWNYWNRLLLRRASSTRFPGSKRWRASQSAGQTENSFRQSQTILPGFEA